MEPAEIFIVTASAPWWKRAIVPLMAIAAFVVSNEWLKWLATARLAAWVDTLARGPRLLLSHWLIWSLFNAVSCLAIWWVMVRAQVLRPPVLVGPSPHSALRWGFGVGLGVSAVTAALWVAMGPGFRIHLDAWGIAGNVLSNFYEEVCYRGLIFGAALYGFRRFWPAAIVSGAVFGATHTQYPVVFQVFTGVVGVAFAVAYFRGRGLFAVWLAHQVSDMLLDTFLKT